MISRECGEFSFSGTACYLLKLRQAGKRRFFKEHEIFRLKLTGHKNEHTYEAQKNSLVLVKKKFKVKKMMSMKKITRTKNIVEDLSK